MGRRQPIAADVVEARLKAVHGDMLEMVRETYRGVGKKATFIDSEHGTWEAYVSNVLVGHGHPKRGRENGQQTCMKLYGVKTPLARGSMREKIEQGWFETYGVSNPLGHGSSVRKTVLDTFQRRYGVSNPQQIPEVNARSAKSRRHAVVKRHWKTGEDVVCVGSYERAVVDWLNNSRTDFKWQVPIKIPGTAPADVAGRTYFIDLYVVDGTHADTYVEIKGGWPRILQKMKWEWFKSENSNAQLWDAKALKLLGIMGRRS